MQCTSRYPNTQRTIFQEIVSTTEIAACIFPGKTKTGSAFVRLTDDVKGRARTEYSFLFELRISSAILHQKRESNVRSLVEENWRSVSRLFTLILIHCFDLTLAHESLSKKRETERGKHSYESVPRQEEARESSHIHILSYCADSLSSVDESITPTHRWVFSQDCSISVLFQWRSVCLSRMSTAFEFSLAIRTTFRCLSTFVRESNL